MTRLWRRLSKREKALVGVALFIFLIVVGRIFVVSPLLERRDWIRSQLEMQPQLLEKNLRYVGQKDEIAGALAKSREALKLRESLLLAGNTDSVRASELQQAVQALAVREGTQVITTRVLNPEPLGPFTKIAIQMEVSGQIDQVTNLIRGIDAADKLLVVDELNIRSLFSPAAIARRPNIPQPAMQNLRASLTVSGFARTEPSAGNGAAQPKGKTGSGGVPGKTQRQR